MEDEIEIEKDTPELNIIQEPDLINKLLIKTPTYKKLVSPYLEDKTNRCINIHEFSYMLEAMKKQNKYMDSKEIRALFFDDFGNSLIKAIRTAYKKLYRLTSLKPNLKHPLSLFCKLTGYKTIDDIILIDQLKGFLLRMKSELAKSVDIKYLLTILKKVAESGKIETLIGYIKNAAPLFVILITFIASIV